MNDRKLKKLFGAVRKETPPTPAQGLDFTVMQAIRAEAKPPTLPATISGGSVFDQLNVLFPRLAWAAAIIIAVCVVGELVSSSGNPSLTESVSQLSDQWLFTPNSNALE